MSVKWEGWVSVPYGVAGSAAERTVGDAGPYSEGRSAFVIVGATCVSPVPEGEMRIDDRWSKSLGFLPLSHGACRDCSPGKGSQGAR